LFSMCELVLKEVKLFLYRPGQTHRAPGG
jgi:hypothetical protein